MKSFKATKNDEGRSLQKFLEKVLFNVPKSRIERIFRKKDLKINNERVNDKKYLIKEGDIVDVHGLTHIDSFNNFEKANINFKTLFENDDVLVVEKKNGITMHGDKNSLDNQVLSYLKFVQKDSFVPSSIGRLDKVTSGIVLYAKNYSVLKEMKEKNDAFKKVYEFKSDFDDEITTNFLIRHDEEMKREKIDSTGRKAITKLWVKENKKYAELVTGRKHQIRATLSKLGVPIYGDTRYGGKPMKRVFLHSTYLKIDGLEKNLKLNGMEFWSQPDW